MAEQPEQAESPILSATKELSAMASFSTKDILRNLDAFCSDCRQVLNLKEPPPCADRSLYVKTKAGSALHSTKDLQERNIATMQITRLTHLQQQENEKKGIGSSTHGVDLQHTLTTLSQKNKELESHLTELENTIQKQEGLDRILLADLEDTKRSFPSEEGKLTQLVGLIDRELTLRDLIDDPNTPKDHRLRQEEELRQVQQQIERGFVGETTAITSLTEAFKEHKRETGKNAHRASITIEKISQEKTIQEHSKLPKKIESLQKELKRISRTAELESSPGAGLEPE